MGVFLDLFIKIMDFFGRYRIILDREDNEPYLERFYIFLKNREHFPFNIFIHRFLKSDPDDLHDHPWDFRTLILYGGYWEYTDVGRYWRGPFSFRYMPACTFHRIELDEKFPYCWTLFIPGKIKKNWGFNTSMGWLPFNEYFENKNSNKKKTV